VVDDERHMGWPVGQRDDTSEEKLRLFLPSSPEKARPFEDIRRAYFRHVLSLCDGNYTRAKDLLGVSDNTLRKWTR